MTDEMPDQSTRCGFVSVIGLPNAGKSTLINTLVGTKVSIVSAKVQTTRTRVLGILTSGAAQIILIDTPGIFDARKTMERAMVGAAYEALDESDIVMHIVDASKKNILDKNKEIIGKIPAGKKCILVLNKIDLVSKPDLLALAAAFNALRNYDATFMISALKGKGSHDMLAPLSKLLPEGPWHFAEDEITDMPMRMMAAEITREKIFNLLHHELPHSTLVHTEHWEEFRDGSVKIDQVIYVARDSQKAIVLGKGGARIKQIGQLARLELEQLFEMRVHLKLLVKVQENWAERPENLRIMGLLE